MAQRMHIVLEDDLDGSEAAETVAFALDGTAYEIDLSSEHAGELRDALALYVGNARKASGARGRRPAARSGSAVGGASAKEIRAWARSNGHDVPERGRIPASVRDAFDSAK